MTKDTFSKNSFSIGDFVDFWQLKLKSVHHVFLCIVSTLIFTFLLYEIRSLNLLSDFCPYQFAVKDLAHSKITQIDTWFRGTHRAQFVNEEAI